MPYHYEEKKGSTQLIAENKDLKSCFQDGAWGLENMIVDTETVKAEKPVDVVVDAKSLKELYKAWLEQVIELGEVNDMVFSEFQINSIQKVSTTQWLLTGEIMGEVFDASRHKRLRDAKKLKIGSVETKEGKEQVSCLCAVS